MMTRKLRTYVRWTCLVVVFMWSFPHEGVHASSSAERRLDGVGVDFVSASNQNIVPPFNVSVDPGCSQDTGEDTYSVIVLSDDTHISNLFQAHDRMCAYSRGLVSVQVANPIFAPRWEDSASFPPFSLGHPPGVSRRVRIYYTSHKTHRAMGAEMRHLRAACEDPSEVTLIIETDEYCTHRPIALDIPSACWAHIARQYPQSPPSPELESRIAYLPLGPRDTFAFVHDWERTPASQRSMFFNAAVEKATAPRRRKLVKIARAVKKEHPTWNTFVNDAKLEAEGYRMLLLNSTITLCPGGHNPETFRMFESLEAGSIPIISRQDYLYPSYMAPFPCGEGSASWNTVAASPFAKEVSVSSWEELPELLQRLKAAPAEYIDRLQADCVAWYEEFMRRTYHSALNFGRGYDLHPQNGPIVLEGFPERSEPYPKSPPYDQYGH